MARYRKIQNNDAVFPIIIIFTAAMWAHRTQLLRLAYVVIGGMICLILFKAILVALKQKTALQFKNIDNLDGLDFEQYVARLLLANGFHNVSLTEKYDFGVDIIAEKNGVRWGIQAKRCSSLVKAHAVRQVVTGLKVYGCDQAMVITNSTYSSVARRLANANDCVLIDRAELSRLARRERII
jgi:HJR/Mrr/RecB family endonuclease